jgi:DNA-binding transcriptional ArsR family regulator
MLKAAQINAMRGRISGAPTERLPLVFGALGDPTRFCIVTILLERRGLCVTDIARVCRLSVAGASHQLKILELAGLVRRVRYGKMICYEIKKSEPAVEYLKKLIHHS